MQNKSPTLGVIAQVAGLSKRAVIQALKDRPGVSDETRKRVKAIAKEYGYGNQSPTLEDISRSLGISKTSVSVALNGGYGVSESTRSKVKAAAQKLGYEINPLISSMMNQVQKGRSKISGPVLGLPFFASQKPCGRFLETCERESKIEPSNSVTKWRSFALARMVSPLITSGVICASAEWKEW